MAAVTEDLLSVVRLLVDDAKGVTVTEAAIEGGTELRLGVAESDRGKVIGRRGRTIDALRALVRARGEKEARALDVELPDD